MASEADRLSTAPDSGDRRRRRDLVPAAVRRALPWLVLATVVLVGGIGLITAGGDTPIGPDAFIDRHLYDHHVQLIREGNWIVHITEPSHLAVVIAIMLIGCAACRSGRAAVTFVLALAIDGAAAEAIKEVVKRKQGPFGAYTFPSGHTAGATVLAMIIVLLCWPGGPLGRRLNARGQRIGMAIAALVVAVVAGAMILMQDHFFTDCLASVPLGATVTVVTGMVVDAIANRLPPGRGKPPIS